VGGQIELVEARSAKPLDDGPVSVIFLNINAKGQVLLSPADREDDEDDTLDSPTQVEGYMKRRAAAETIKTRKDRPEATLILRIDKRCPFEKSYPIMKACRDAGYSEARFRAYRFCGSDE